MRRALIAIIILILLLIPISILSIGIGAAEIPAADIFKVLFSSGQEGLETVSAIVWQIRLPRLCLALIVGAMLSASGLAMQALFRNPLADPYIIGSASGAALGATLGLLGGLSISIAGIPTIPLQAFIGSILITSLVYFLARLYGRISTYNLLLIGIAIAGLCSSLTALILILSAQDLHQVLFWLMGSFSAANWENVRIVLPYFFIGITGLFLITHSMNVLQMGEEEATGVGLSTEKAKKILLLLSTVLAAAAVAVSGIIGFIGLMVPHMMRLVVGPRHGRLLISSILAGALLMTASDVGARWILAPAEIPVGIITTCLGVPFFLFLLLRKRLFDL